MIIGLTGGIAAGKSTVRGLLSAKSGAETFDADKCVHRLLAEDAKLASEIGKWFGTRYLRQDGRPDRSALRELVFHQADARRKLEGLLHPLVRSAWMTQRDGCFASGRSLLADIPLLYETEAEQFFDEIVVVACTPATQLQRLAARGISPETAQAMLASQWPIGQKVSRADHVVWNDGSLAALSRQTEFLANQLFPA